MAANKCGIGNNDFGTLSTQTWKAHRVERTILVFTPHVQLKVYRRECLPAALPEFLSVQHPIQGAKNTRNYSSRPSSVVGINLSWDG
jgi:hypothetical protein